MEFKVAIACALAVTTIGSYFVDCQHTITDCGSYRTVYETFSSCALFSMYNISDRNTILFDKDSLNRQDLLDVLNYWCSVLATASSCTDGKALKCRNRGQIVSLVSNTGGVCKNGQLDEEYKTMIPESFMYDTRCMSQALDIIDTCENKIHDIEYHVGIVDGVNEMRRIVEQVLVCNAKELRSSNTCVGSRDSILFYTFRTLTFSVPHALGIDLPVTVVMDIVGNKD
ncbi:uncharacterized protein LOC123534173 [Mercenaria mercenaria]|uniref:uncharacterized protein LOC123534173 n=1 Tax=Mercenaria mercenaria TaxID=6596 RepID=UPI00234E825D|nr:uncharacterized protein LOC123534173 [Mercenaria mercenaria]